jgi:MFS family permease
MAPFVAVMTGNYLFPIYVQNILQAPAVVFGRGEIAFAFGAVLAGVLGPKLISRYSAPNVAMVMMAIFICGLILLGSLQSVTAFYIALVLVGLGGAGSRVFRSTVLYTVVPNEIMGRVNVTLSSVDRLLRTLLQFGAIYVVIKADAAMAFIGLVLFVGVALIGAFTARNALKTYDTALHTEPPKS